MAPWTSYTVSKIHVIFVAFLIFSYVILKLSITNKTLSLQYQANSLLNFTRISAKHGYYFTKEHTVSTDDGYLLTIFRMVKSKKCFGKMKHPPVILMHGLLMSSDAWFDAGPEASLAYLLSDECFDIWLGNFRGNYYGRRHIKLNPDVDPEFWNFSVNEMGMYDIPAIVDYVINYTAAKKLYYIGYSQGAGSFVITCSERPGYSAKVGLFVALAPSTRLTHTQSRIFRAIDQFRIFENALTFLGVKEVLPKGGIGQAILSYVCKYDIFLETVCKARGAILMLDSEHVGSVNDKTWGMVFANFPAGTSLRTLARYGQSLWSEKYQKFDHGESRNLKVYGTLDPPYYNISAVSTPSVIIYGKSDNLVEVRDIKWLTKSFPNVQELVEVEDRFWNHFDFMYSQYIKLMVFPKVFKYLTQFSL